MKLNYSIGGALLVVELAILLQIVAMQLSPSTAILCTMLLAIGVFCAMQEQESLLLGYAAGVAALAGITNYIYATEQLWLPEPAAAVFSLLPVVFIAALALWMRSRIFRVYPNEMYVLNSRLMPRLPPIIGPCYYVLPPFCEVMFRVPLDLQALDITLERINAAAAGRNGHRGENLARVTISLQYVYRFVGLRQLFNGPSRSKLFAEVAEEAGMSVREARLRPDRWVAYWDRQLGRIVRNSLVAAIQELGFTAQDVGLRRDELVRHMADEIWTEIGPMGLELERCKIVAVFTDEEEALLERRKFALLEEARAQAQAKDLELKLSVLRESGVELTAPLVEMVLLHSSGAPTKTALLRQSNQDGANPAAGTTTKMVWHPDDYFAN